MYPQVFGKYVLERELARGGMARVVLATLRGAGGFEKKLVVKQIRDELACDDDFVRRFVLEAKTTVNLAHPNIVPVYELGVELGTYFLAMEFVEGASLAELLRARPRVEPVAPVALAALAAPSATTVAPAGAIAAGAEAARAGLSPEEVAYVGVEVCRALDYAHRRMNVVHRDVTPRNVMVDEEGQVKVIDFGIAAPVATAPSGHGVFGSPGHMPPEQMDATELTPAADVFAVAVLLMELWSGRAPFRRRTREDIEAAMRAPHPKPSDADARLLPLDDVIGRAMSLDAAQRPQHADDLGRALRRFLAGIDLGDLARHLGDRVRDLREHPLPPPTEPRPILQRPPSRPTATQVGTKTFAARDDVGALGQPPPQPDAIPEVSTRRIESMRPSARGREIDTAAEPLEADPRGDARVPRKRVAVAGAIGACGLAVVAFLLGRAATAPARASSTGPQASIVPTAIARLVEAPPASSPAPPAAATANPVATAPSARAQLVLLGDGTRVSVDGVPRGPCPARVGLEPGTHTVVFSFPPTGESKGESLTLRGGDHATLRADFTGATPSIRVQAD
jgi:serine/threonine protein kinase